MSIDKASLIRRLLLVIAVILCLLLLTLELVHHRHYGHFVSYGLHVEVLSKDYNIGIPGQTKLYWAELSNYSFLPVILTACDYISDTMTQGTEYPYAVQRWDASSNSWQ